MIHLLLVTLILQLANSSAAEVELSSQKSGFPHKLWVFWDRDISQASIFTQLCVNNLRHYT
jgi:hypothetical protein